MWLIKINGHVMILVDRVDQFERKMSNSTSTFADSNPFMKRAELEKKNSFRKWTDNNIMILSWMVLKDGHVSMTMHRKGFLYTIHISALKTLFNIVEDRF